MEPVIGREKSEFEEKVVQIDRVARVQKGGRRFRFRATVVVGNRNGKVGVGIAKGNEVSVAIRKAAAVAKKEMITVPLKNGTIPYKVKVSYAGAKVLLLPAREGTGVIAGGAVRAVVNVAGVRNILSKVIGSSNAINNVYATYKALEILANSPHLSKKNIPAELESIRKLRLKTKLKPREK